MLYIVSTPIGNLGDITHRAVEVLKSVDLIACEDTRHTRILCAAYGIKKPLCSYYEYNKIVRGEYLLRLLREGKMIALVSDAGTPGISDPGFNLIRSALDAGIPVTPVPGPTALISALSASGFPANRFFFEGFLPVKSVARKKRLKELAGLKATVVAYESPHRILATLEDMREVLKERPVAVVREITKKFEEVLRGDAGFISDQLRRRHSPERAGLPVPMKEGPRPERAGLPVPMKEGPRPKGEFVVVF
ncbi:MAG: 16S rRNA (cytidine(1402)-2'-O)-methyltransferase [Candidatus Omnitrophica bacterium]|nr:16S rRNA (cytidine(1402)-2'-O)-methyltransferase [Candidatus Omnitrophota bacterium]